MPKRPGQHVKGGDPDVHPVVKGGIAMLVRPIQRGGGFDMRQGCTVIAAKDQRISEGAMADQERAGGRIAIGLTAGSWWRARARPQ